MAKIKFLKQFFTYLTLLLFSLSLYGCSTLSYVGEDYNQQNIQTVKTDEEFVFNVYKKTIDNANIKIGITRTPVPEILALYIQVENLSYETPYIFKVEDLKDRYRNIMILYDDFGENYGHLVSIECDDYQLLKRIMQMTGLLIDNQGYERNGGK